MNKYELTEEKLKKIANLAVQENGEECVSDEVSLMANLFELQSTYKDIYDFIRNGKWFSRAPYWMDYGTSTKSAVEKTRDVLVNGARTLPAYINEHDCFTDIEWIRANGKTYTAYADIKDRAKYVKDKTVIHNRYNSTYTFYCFPGKYSDPFGYTEEAKKKRGDVSALSRAKILLRQPQGSVMTGYTPEGKSCFVKAGAWTTTPKRGDVIYFYSSAKGRVGHTGIVEKVDGKTVYTIEGNTSSSAYAENGGCVARHSYNISKIGGTNRVNGFGRPDFAGAGVTADEFVKTAAGELGYLEKRSNKDLDSKTANAGSNNFTKYQRDVGAGNGDQWCQYFVDAVALYTCGGENNSKKILAGQKWLNKYYGDLLKKCFGSELEEDGIYGSKSRASALAVWKDVLNRKKGANLTPANTNFGDSCKKWAAKAEAKYGDFDTFVYICKFLMAAKGFYKGAMNSRGTLEFCKALQKFQKANGIPAKTAAKECKCTPETWDRLFN